MKASPLHTLDDVRELFNDIVAPWVSKGHERRVVMQAAWHKRDDSDLLGVELSIYGDSVDASDTAAIDAARQLDLKAEVESEYLKGKLGENQASEVERLRTENRRLREKISEWADRLDAALTKMEAAWTEMRRQRQQASTPTTSSSSNSTPGA